MNDHDLLQQVHNELHTLHNKYDAEKEERHKLESKWEGKFHELDTKLVEGFTKSESDHKHLYDKVHEANQVQDERLKEHGVQIDGLGKEVADIKGRFKAIYGAIALGVATATALGAFLGPFFAK